MAATIPLYAIGKHQTAVSVTAQDVDASGNLTDNATGAKTLVGKLDSVEPSSENDLEMIQAMDIRRNNNVIVGSGSEYTLTEILKQNDSPSSPTNILRSMAFGFTGLPGGTDYIKFTSTHAGRSDVFFAVVRSYREQRVRGKNTGIMVIAMVDPNEANPGLT